MGWRPVPPFTRDELASEKSAWTLSCETWGSALVAVDWRISTGPSNLRGSVVLWDGPSRRL